MNVIELNHNQMAKSVKFINELLNTILICLWTFLLVSHKVNHSALLALQLCG